MTRTHLALITGRGALPAAVARAQEIAPLICALEGHVPDDLTVDHSFCIEHLGGFVSDLRARGVREVCFCGAITRPEIDPTRIDAATAPLVPVLAAAVAGGEDSALRAVLGIFEQAGFDIRAAHDLAPELLPRPGVLTATGFSDAVSDMVTIADQVATQQGARDLGQACVIRNAEVIAREDGRGTDAMLRDLSRGASGASLGDDPFGAILDMATDALDGVADWLSGPEAEARHAPKGGVLFKAPKPGQDLRVDVPTIGPQTARRAAEAGLDGIVIPRGGVMVLDQPRVIAILDGRGMFLWVR